MTAPDTGSPYGLHRPTMTDARDAMHRVHGYTGRSAWEQLLTAMAGLDPVSRLCAHALRIRLSSHTHLSAAHTITRSPA